MPIAPAFVEDGDFGIILQNGAPRPEFPFFEQVGSRAFIYRIKMRVLQSSFIPPAPMSQLTFPLGICYLVDIEQPSTQNDTDLVEYGFVYASLPPRLTEYGSATYTVQQTPKGAGDTKLKIQYTDTFPATIYRDFSLFQPLPPLFRGKLIGSSNYLTGASGPVIQAGPWTNGNANGSLVLAQNSTAKRWLGQIYYRESVYVNTAPVNAGGTILNPA